MQRRLYSLSGKSVEAGKESFSYNIERLVNTLMKELFLMRHSETFFSMPRPSILPYELQEDADYLGAGLSLICFSPSTSMPSLLQYKIADMQGTNPIHSLDSVMSDHSSFLLGAPSNVSHQVKLSLLPTH